MKSFLQKIAPFLFAFWTLGIMAAYFLFYKTYGQFYLVAFALLLFFAAFFILLFFCISLPSFFRGKEPLIIRWFRRLPDTLSIPVKNLVVVLYGVTATWILLIFLLSFDGKIATNSIVSVFLVTLITLAGFSIGSRLIRRFRIEYQSFLERFILSTLLGFGILMLIVYLAGMTGFLYSTLAYALVLGILFFFRREWQTLFSDIEKTILPWRIKPFLTFDNFAIIASFILLVFATTGLLSQFAAGWDEMHTYQAFPHAYAEAHRIVNFPYWHASGYPQNTEMLFVLGFLLKGFTAAAGMNTVFYFFIPCILVLLKRIILPKTSSATVILLYFLSAIPYVMISNDHKIEPTYWSYTLLATLYLLKFFETKRQKMLLLSCIIMGIAAGTKYNFFSIILPSFLVVLFFFPRKFNFKKRLANIILCLAIIALCFSPWAVKNIIFSGNPIEPALGDILSRNSTFLNTIGRSYSNHIHEHFMDVNILLGNQEIKNWKYYFLLPFQFTFKYDTKFFEGIANIGPLYLLFLPVFLAILFSKKKTGIVSKIKQYKPRYYPIGVTLVIVFTQTILWLFLAKQVPWYNMTAFLTLFPFMATFLQLNTYQKTNIPLKMSIIALFLSTAIFRFDGIFRNSALFTKQDDGNYANYEIAEFINKSDLRGLIWDTEGFSLNYFIHDAESRVVYDQHLHIFRFLHEKYSGNDDFLNVLKKMNISFFILKKNSLEGWFVSAKNVSGISPQSSRLFQESYIDYLNFQEEYLTEVYRFQDNAVYMLKNDAKSHSLTQ